MDQPSDRNTIIDPTSIEAKGRKTMRKLLTFLIALASIVFAVCSPAASQIIGGGVWGDDKPRAPAPTLVTGKYAAYQNGYVGGRSFINMNNGVSYPSGAVVVVFAVASDGMAFTSPQMGSVSLTPLASATNATQGVQVFYADLPAGAVDTFTFSNQGCCNRFGAYAIYFTGVRSVTLAGAYQSGWASKADPQLANTPASLTVPAGGFGVLFEGSFSGTVPTTSTFLTTTPSFLTSSSGDPGGSTCASPGGGLDAKS
jgi:hypothetical protein